METTPTVMCKVFNQLYEMSTEDIKRVEIEAYGLWVSKDPKEVAIGKALAAQCRYVIERRERENG